MSSLPIRDGAPSALVRVSKIAQVLTLQSQVTHLIPEEPHHAETEGVAVTHLMVVTSDSCCPGSWKHPQMESALMKVFLLFSPSALGRCRRDQRTAVSVSTFLQQFERHADRPRPESASDCIISVCPEGNTRLSVHRHEN